MSSSFPSSASSFFINLFGGACYIFCTYICLMFNPEMNTLMLCAISVLCAMIPIVLCEILILKVHRRPSVGFLEKPSPDRERATIKLLGLYGAMGLLMIIYFMVPEYTNSDFYDVSFFFMLPLMFIYIVAGGIYVYEFDSRLNNPKDGLWHFGCLLCLRWDGLNWGEVRSFFRSLMLRGFFLPIMLGYLAQNVIMLQDGSGDSVNAHLGGLADDPAFDLLRFFFIAYFYFSVMDVLFAVMGYIMTLRILDTHIRSTDSSFVGWFVCLGCYTPIWEALFISSLFYNFYNGNSWYEWMAGMPAALIIVWGVLVVLAMFFESLTTLTFGLRFSNLTYRGIITSGLFRFTKHPQYVSKMFNRFFVCMPFLSTAGLFGVMQTMLMFLGICFIYYLRARTEENHLSRYPEYIQYANQMNQKSIFRFMNRFMPFLEYSQHKAHGGKLF